METVIGLDPSERKAGFAVFDGADDACHVHEYGRLKTSSSDGILIQQLLMQQKNFDDLFARYPDLKMVSMEAPLLEAGSSEKLFALNQFLHEVFLNREIFVICFPPQQLKALAVPYRKANVTHKNWMTAEAKEKFNLMDNPVQEDEADAMHAGWLGHLFYNWHFTGRLKDEDLPEKVLKAFSYVHTYTRGPKAGSKEYKGLIYRENELFYDFKKIKERLAKKEAIKNGITS